MLDFSFEKAPSFSPWGETWQNLRTLSSGAVLLVVLHRPRVMNALSEPLMSELARILLDADTDPGIGCVVLTGGTRCFAAGADLAEMRGRSHVDAYLDNYVEKNWSVVKRFRKPLIAAVAGHAIGGGCELALACDYIIAADTACFSLPEVLVGTVSATQRLPRIIGKAKAMEMILTGRRMSADEAERTGVVARVVALDALHDEAVGAAGKIAALSRPVTLMAKECVLRSFETGLDEGLMFERRVFHSTLSFDDCAEGLTALLEKREPRFSNR